ncbi:MAG TPA: hypothetical protein ENF30_00200 [Candidatus Desulfofervidus auxilii]|uniref:Uncharacterized protein n=1 Tax=Desulfofervidus auxilii TaxID=1621989 RepID=A0A7V0I9Q1_DESA2|nr:hypothetical protein [Candidatus Desulfofervidus auxilii]
MNRLGILAKTLRDMIEVKYGISITRRGIKKTTGVPVKSLWRTHSFEEIEDYYKNYEPSTYYL